ncbi:hypothetical protein [Parachryseolinea silvisoli]|uniref:hypothetical protein n=1 Tax=Parachryseolinea silvisoli TaxID=2873601 RepID=UPI002265E5F9|nr:hypothetical protein [Parachryseolinea silvisoli]MCD9016420.1 hypothetical protein [Parachryseolinea silvisoli]
MKAFEEFKQNVFRVVEDQLPLADFEAWLYVQSELAEQMHIDAIYEAFCFHYGKRNANVEFTNTLLPYFDQDEFLLWKVKANLQDVIEGKPTTERILYEWYRTYDDKLGFLNSLGWYVSELECMEFTGLKRNEILDEAKESAADLLDQILRQEKGNPDFKITNFKYPQ